MVYRFIDDNKQHFGVRWLLRRFSIYPNAYYNYKKARKQAYNDKKKSIYSTIEEIYHENNGVLGYRNMKIFLERKHIYLSCQTVHKYMNTDLKIYSIVRKKKPSYRHGKAYKKFPNLLNQDFVAAKINEKWCTDFTYITLANGQKRYNCSIVDLHDRSVVASLNGKEITSDLAIKTVKKAFAAQHITNNGNILLHSDQGTQFTSKEFVNFCKGNGITQSMSKAGYPYDNAPMERYFNTLKNELINLKYYHNDKELNSDIDNFAYVWYNHLRPHTFNNGLTPFEARYKKIRSKCYKNT